MSAACQISTEWILRKKRKNTSMAIEICNGLSQRSESAELGGGGGISFLGLSTGTQLPVDSFAMIWLIESRYQVC